MSLEYDLTEIPGGWRAVMVSHDGTPQADRDYTSGESWAAIHADICGAFSEPMAPGADRQVSDADYTCLGGEERIVYTSITATRTVTLPPIAGVAIGTSVRITDESASLTASIKLIIAPTSGEQLNGGVDQTVELVAPYRSATVERCSAGWVLVAQV